MFLKDHFISLAAKVDFKMLKIEFLQVYKTPTLKLMMPLYLASWFLGLSERYIIVN